MLNLLNMDIDLGCRTYKFFTEPMILFELKQKPYFSRTEFLFAFHHVILMCYYDEVKYCAERFEE